MACCSAVLTDIQLVATWRNVEQQVTAINTGQRDLLSIPKALPCPSVTWNFVGTYPELAAHQWRVHYGIPKDVPVRVETPANVHSRPVR